jgi:hypothetical protein
MKAQILFVFLLLMGACSQQARKVDCQEHLTAINPPAPVVKAISTSAAPTPETKPEIP